MLACDDGNVALVRMILARATSIDSADVDGVSALLRVVKSKDIALVELLLQHHASPDSPDKLSTSSTPLMWAAAYGYKEVTELLLDYAADINAKSDEFGWTALMKAANNGHMNTVEVLLEHHADPNIQSSYGATALMKAVTMNHQSIVTLLIAQGALVNLQNSYGSTALMWAVGNNNVEMVKLLLSHNAAVDLRDSGGRTALRRASMEDTGGAKELLNDIYYALVDAGSNPHLKDHEGKDACSEDNLRLLLKAYCG
jgi:ankyrin repeat protein